MSTETKSKGLSSIFVFAKLGALLTFLLQESYLLALDATSNSGELFLIVKF